VIARVHSFAAVDARARRDTPEVPDTAGAPCVDVPLPDLTRFNELLSISAVPQDSADEPFTTRADVAPPPGRSSVVFT
jgi:hypothetical protein